MKGERSTNEIKSIGNYMPSNYDASRIVSVGGGQQPKIAVRKAKQ